MKKGIELDVDWIALSFIQSPEDIKDLRKNLNKPKWASILKLQRVLKNI